MENGVSDQNANIQNSTSSSTANGSKWHTSDSVDVANRAGSFAQPELKKDVVDVQTWLKASVDHGFIRIYPPEASSRHSELIPCGLETTAHKICLQIGKPPNSLHVQFHGDVIRRLDPEECPLAMQSGYLESIGYTDTCRIQEEGPKEELRYLVKFYSGKISDYSTYSRHHLSGLLHVRQGKMLKQWTQRFCAISGTRLLIYRDKTKNYKPTIIQLAKGSIETVEMKGHPLCLKLTPSVQGERSIYLSIGSESEFTKWLKKCKKATAKLPTHADLSNCHLEAIPDTVFMNTDLQVLNLRHNVLRERPLDDDAYTIGWIEDITRFQRLNILNLADNDLGHFPKTLCEMKSLTELNLSGNQIDEIPAEIKDLTNMQLLHLHKNRISDLPESMVCLNKLVTLVLAFNLFSDIPDTLLRLVESSVCKMETVIISGNKISQLPPRVVNRMSNLKKADFRLNHLTLSMTESIKFTCFENLTHLDVRDNQVGELLDLRLLKALEYLNCERNQINNLQLNGTQLKYIYAAHNDIQHLSVSPKPEWLAVMNVSYNRIQFLPEALATCFFLQRLYASHNALKALPERILCDAKQLRSIHVNHNNISQLPLELEDFKLEEFLIQHNRLANVPANFFKHAIRLKIFNASKNRLVHLPSLNPTTDLNKIQELYLSHNYLQDDVMRVVCGFNRLKILYIAYNQIYTIRDSDICRLEMLLELNVSGNRLKALPMSLLQLPALEILRAHSNQLLELPDFSKSSSLKVLDVASNKFLNVSVPNLMDSQISLLDMSCNEQLSVSVDELQSLQNKKSVTFVDLTGQNRQLPGANPSKHEVVDSILPWQVGLAETSGTRNKLCVGVIKKLCYKKDEALFAMFDGGQNDFIPTILQKSFTRLLEREIKHPLTKDKYLKYTMLSAHRRLRSAGHGLGASATVIHLVKSDSANDVYTLNLANIGDTEAVLCRGREVLLLTRPFTVSKDYQDKERVCNTGGIVTEDNKVNGSSEMTRMLGCTYMHPQLIPDPHQCSIALTSDDQFIILANRNLWRQLSYQEAVAEIVHVNHPVLAAKKLQDLAQSYGCKENISVLVVRLHLGGHVIGCDDSSECDSLDERFGLGTVVEEDPSQSEEIIQPLVKHSPAPNTKMRRFIKKNRVTEWENVLQHRLSEEVKEHELQSSVNELMSSGSSVAKDSDFRTSLAELSSSDSPDSLNSHESVSRNRVGTYDLRNETVAPSRNKVLSDSGDEESGDELERISDHSPVAGTPPEIRVSSLVKGDARCDSIENLVSHLKSTSRAAADDNREMEKVNDDTDGDCHYESLDELDIDESVFEYDVINSTLKEHSKQEEKIASDASEPIYAKVDLKKKMSKKAAMVTADAMKQQELEEQEVMIDISSESGDSDVDSVRMGSLKDRGHVHAKVKAYYHSDDSETLTPSSSANSISSSNSSRSSTTLPSSVVENIQQRLDQPVTNNVRVMSRVASIDIITHL
ncbi:PH domain leucine-rich repeat-containing protein phosphatase 2-like [Tubulanus polymorphus]|uniref:PH domain leucine-rich repeat-containing protein phosphatase 2-like n=1 Tax=Tubulanus polymorphus TaxID=672921 RepID=UPI003DA59461